MNRAILVVMSVMAALVVGIGIIVLVVVAGGGDDNGSSTQGQPTDKPTDDGGGRAEGELRLPGSDPLTLDPAVAQDATSATYIVEIFGGLVTLDRDLKAQPDLAQELPTAQNGGKTVNADGTVTYTFRLRDGVQFHDRKPVTADDVKYSLERATDPATQSLVAAFFLGDIVGVREKLRGEASEIAGVKVVDDGTIAITIDEDKPNFLYKLTYPTAFVVDQTQVEDDDNWTLHPNGTGPFKLREWEFGERLVLEANPRYHLGAPSIETVRYLLTGSPLTQYEAGEVDVSGIGINDLERVQDPADSLNDEYQSGPSLSIDYIGFNTAAPPFDDPLVRKAFAMAIDRGQIAGSVLLDALPVANSIIMPGMPAYNPAARGPEFDPAAARDLLEQSRYAGSDELEGITLAESGTGASAGRSTSAIVEMWRDNLGVEVEIEQAEPATFYQNVAQGLYQMYDLGWIMDYPDEEDLLNFHFDSDSPNNDTRYSNPGVDRLLRQALLETNAQRRVQLYQQAEQTILDDTPWIPLFFGAYHAVVKPYVRNFIFPSSIVPTLRFVEITAE